MLIELAHYTIIFALAAVGLQTLLLTPTLWSGGSAVAIRLGFRGACFTSALLMFAFFVLLYGFAVHDFSLAVVFETFDSQSSLFYALQAFCSSREGFFFTFIIALSVFTLIGFSKKDLATYQERGRYLFSAGFLIFFLLTLMLSTADPFVRIEEPPFEGVGFNPEWRPAHKTLELLFIFAAYAALIISFIKIISMYSKGRQFVTPALRGCLFALTCLICALGSKLMTGFTTAENGALWQWTPDNSLLLSVFILTAGQAILLFFCRYSRVFTNWIIVFAAAGLAFFSADFFAAEYRLFSLSADEVYFPNPVTALCAFAGMTCFFLFLSSVMIKRSLPENNFFVFSRESFVGLAAAALLTAGFSIGALSLMPTLFMFLPDLPLRLLPALFKDILTTTGIVFTFFFFIAFKKRSLGRGWVKTDWKTDLWFWGTALTGICFCLLEVDNGLPIVLSFLPAVLIFNSFLTARSVKIPSSFSAVLEMLKNTSALTYGLFFNAAGILIFSAALAYCVFNGKDTSATMSISEASSEVALPCRIEALSGKTAAGTAQYRLACTNEAGTPAAGLLSGKPVFQWPEKKLDATLLQIGRFTFRLIRAEQTREDLLTIRTAEYPLLPLAGSGLFLMCLGLVFLIFSTGKEQTL